MCAPVITSITFDKTSYSAGATITATVNYTACCTNRMNVEIVDTGNRTWTVSSNDHHTQAIVTATA